MRASRDVILAEIRRCATVNGGVPLGRDRFEAETGIRESEWLGSYWTRWSDAVVEAGFEPNTLQRRVHDDLELMRALALLTRDLGRFPTQAEIRMHRKSDRTFPAAGVFVRLGNRAAQVELVARFAADTDGFEDVGAICAPLLTHEQDATPDGPAKVGVAGFVYLVRSGKHHKIGRSNNLGRRSYEIALQLPERLQLVHAFETDDPSGIERYWHERFADRRVNGEWFLLTKSDIAAFKARRRFM